MFCLVQLLQFIVSGEAMEIFMNENWEIVHRDLSSVFEDAIDSIVTSIVSPIIRRVPFDEIFLP